MASKETNSQDVFVPNLYTDLQENTGKYMKCAEVFVDCVGNIFYKCFICKVSLGKSSKYMSHLHGHYDENTYPCHRCNLSFKTFNLLVEHASYEHLNIASESATISNIDENECNNICDLPNPSVDGRSDADHDCNEISTDDTVVKTEDCSTEFVTTEFWIKECNPIEIENEVAEIIPPSPARKKRKERTKTKYVCSVCGKIVSSSKGLINHMRIHTGEKPHKCQYCDRAFNSWSAHRVHERQHTGVKAYMCNQCGATFFTGSQLNTHFRKHAGIKSYKCTQPECDKQFYTLHQLKDHIRVHTGERPFACKICEKSFRSPNALRQHNRLHSDVKRYVCNICEMAFAQAAGLHGHKKTRHPIPPTNV